MANSRETFAFPEAALYIWQGGSSAIATYAESIEVTVNDTNRKFLFPTTGVGYAGRARYVRTDRNVTMNIGQLHAGIVAFQMMNSAVNFSGTLNFACSADGSTNSFTIWSARAASFQIVGREKNIWRATTNWIATDISGVSA